MSGICTHGNSLTYGCALCFDDMIEGRDMINRDDIELFEAFLGVHAREPGSLSVAMIATDAEPDWDMSLETLRQIGYAARAHFDGQSIPPGFRLVPVEATEWRPIESAPTDGTKILLFWPQRPPADVGWHTFDDHAPPRALREGFRAHGDRCIPPQQPTHWMPLPASPTPPEKETP